MKREIHHWHSSSLNRTMEIAVYGHYGFALLLFPTAGGDFLECERNRLIEAIQPFIDAGKFKAFSVNTVNNESWLNEHVPPPARALRHQQYNQYIAEEVVPFIRSHTSKETAIITAGASFGALHAANSLFRRPDLFDGTIAMSGAYDLKVYSKGYYDDNVYFNSPVDYLPNLNDDTILRRLRSKEHIYILSGQGAWEKAEYSVHLAEVLAGKGIPHHLDLWGHDIPHDWPTWLTMLPHVLKSRLGC